MMTTNQKPTLFESIRKTDGQGNEFWSARELAGAQQTIQELRGTMPEELPVADSIKKLGGGNNVRQLKKSP